MLLSLEHVTVHYDTAEAVKDISINVLEGDVVSVIGSNGAGKSTILKTISGLLPLSSGSIYVQGTKINGMPVHGIVKRGIAYVPEGRRPFPYMSVFENLKIGAYSRKDKGNVKRDLENIYSLFPFLKSRRRQKAGSLSGGEQQMLVIARALMSRPRLLMMDEPSLGLAPLIIEGLAKVIKDINHDGVSILLVEQNAGLVTRVTNMGYVLEVGKIVLSGKLNELITNDKVRESFLGG